MCMPVVVSYLVRVRDELAACEEVLDAMAGYFGPLSAADASSVSFSEGSSEQSEAAASSDSSSNSNGETKPEPEVREEEWDEEVWSAPLIQAEPANACEQLRNADAVKVRQ